MVRRKFFRAGHVGPENSKGLMIEKTKENNMVWRKFFRTGMTIRASHADPENPKRFGDQKNKREHLGLEKIFLNR